MLSTNQALPQANVELINIANGTDLADACNKCGDVAFHAARAKLYDEATNLRQSLKEVLPKVPIVSLQHPMGWAYEPLAIVTAQTVTGTGMFSDVASAFTDLFGTQSGSYNAKLRAGENLCKDQLRGQALELGGNAVLAVDVDYAEVGGQRAMLMVCMTGTAVRVTATEPADPDYLSTAAKAFEQAQRVRFIERALENAR